ncbi:MAG: helix-turn-helix transcriptional regulator [Amaricoccus sp.]
MATTANEVDAHVGQRMRKRRESLGMSQGQLGRHLGLTFSQVQKYEKGANRIGAGRLYLLASVLSVPVHYFFEGVPDGHEAVRSGRNDELATLDDAFLSIDDPETRQSVLALVCSLSAAKQAGRPRRRAS